MFVNIPGIASWKEPVSSSSALPTSDNNNGDVRLALNTGIIWEWNGSAWITLPVSGYLPLTGGTMSGNLLFSSGNIGEAIPASATIQNITYTADPTTTVGFQGNDISIEYTSGGTAGSEVVSLIGLALSVQIENGVSTATQIKTAIDAQQPGYVIVVVNSNIAQATQAPTFLTGGGIGTNSPANIFATDIQTSTLGAAILYDNNGLSSINFSSGARELVQADGATTVLDFSNGLLAKSNLTFFGGTETVGDSNQSSVTVNGDIVYTVDPMNNPGSYGNRFLIHYVNDGVFGAETAEYDPADPNSNTFLVHIDSTQTTANGVITALNNSGLIGTITWSLVVGHGSNIQPATGLLPFTGGGIGSNSPIYLFASYPEFIGVIEQQVYDNQGFLALDINARKLYTPNGITNILDFSNHANFGANDIETTGAIKGKGQHLEPDEGASVASVANARTLNMGTKSSYAHLLNENVTFTLSNCVAGGSYIIRVTGDATNPYTVDIGGGATVTWENTTGTPPAAVPINKSLILSIYAKSSTEFFVSFKGNYPL